MLKTMLLVLSISLFSTVGFAKVAVANRAPANAAVDPLAPLADPLAPLPEKSCDEAFKNADSGKVSDVAEAFSACSEAADAICAKFSDGTGDGRYLTGLCRAKAAHAGYKAAKGMK